jgi:hypothetical protein
MERRSSRKIFDRKIEANPAWRLTKHSFVLPKIITMATQINQEAPLDQHWTIEDDQLARQCEDVDPWNQFWSAYPKKARKFSDMGLLVAMFLCMASAMLRIKSR